MKKTLLAALLALAGFAHATDAALWADYKASRDGAKAALATLETPGIDRATADKALSEAQTLYAAASTTAKALNRNDIVAWQLNNSAYAAIMWFKAVTSYSASLATVEAMKASKEKMAALADLRTKLSADFKTIEAGATSALAEAGTLSQDESLQSAVSSNKAFLAWVAQFTEKK